MGGGKSERSFYCLASGHGAIATRLPLRIFKCNRAFTRDPRAPLAEGRVTELHYTAGPFCNA